MQLTAICFWAVASLASLAASRGDVVRDGSQESGSVVHKVVVMLTDMVATATAEKKAEEVSFAEFNQWCTNEKASLSSEIKGQGEKIDMHSAEVINLDAEAAELGRNIAAMQADVEKATKDLSDATARREEEHKAFLAEESDYSESVDALERAIMVLEKQAYDRPALLQLVNSQQLPSKAQDMVAAFAEMMADSDNATDAAGLAYSEPEADAYEFQSHDVVGMLRQLLDDFQDQLANARKEETTAVHNYDMLKQDLTSFIERTNEDITEHVALKEQKHAQSAANSKQLAKSQELKAAGEKTLGEVNAECFEKTESFNEKQQLRTEELEALQEAIKILSQEEVQGLASESFLQARVATALAQMSDSRGFLDAQSSKEAGIRRRLSAFLTEEAKRLNSSKIEAIALQAASDPFGKVKILVRDLMERLLKEAHQDATKEGFCDKELGVNKQTRESLAADIEGLTAAIDTGKANIAAMTQEIADLTGEVAGHNDAMAEATKLRNGEKAENKATVKDCEEGELAVKQAVAVLKEFYAKALKATALLQGQQGYPYMGSEEWYSLANTSYEGKADKGHKEGMQTFGDMYAGQQDEAGGVLAMLDVILSDFASLRTETEATEKVSHEQFEQFMQASKTDVAAKSKKIELTTADKKGAEEKLRNDGEDRQLAEDKLGSANRYHDDLKAQCFTKGVTFEDRVAARAAEIQSLKEALKLLGKQESA